MEVPFLYMKFWTNQYKNKISPKYMYKNRTFCSQLVFIFFKSVASRQTVQTAVQTTAETLYTPGLIEIIWELFAKKSADILSFRHSFTLSKPGYIITSSNFKISTMNLVRTSVLVEVRHYMYVILMKWKQSNLKTLLPFLKVGKVLLPKGIFQGEGLDLCIPCSFMLNLIRQKHIPRLVPWIPLNLMIIGDIARNIRSYCPSLMLR